MTSALFSPTRIAGLELANRIVVSPMCQYSADDGVPSDWHLNHLGMLANSGAALVVLEATGVERRGRITHGCLGLYSDDCEAGLTRVVAHCRRYGSAKLGIQIGHAGRKASASRPWEGSRSLAPGEDPWETIAPSAIPFGPGWHVPREMTEEDMERVRDAFVAAARRAVRIGFDAIELHGAHGYLLHSFVSPISNKRTDSYGGTLAGRVRFPIEVAKAVRSVVPSAVPLGARITGDDGIEGGLTPDDAVTFAKALKAEGLDFVCVSSGGVSTDARLAQVPAMNAPYAEKVKRESGISTRVVGLISTPKQADKVVSDGKADMVALARGFLDNPHWAWHAAQALGADVPRPPQYQRATPKVWPAASYTD
jgi:2,4-dienoyl-CoA reductase-like NADH-dependent reductase (Old Yellow Enzyme family)